jgi:glycosyltransferase involved in cell wall biosynthesis
MKILYHFRTRGTGAEAVHISGIANALEKLGHRVVFSSPSGADPRKNAGTNPYREPGNPGLLSRISRLCPGFVFELLEMGYNAAAFVRNAKLLRNGPFHAIYERHAFYLCATAWLARRRKLPLIVEVNELVGDPRVREQPFFSPLARWADRIVFRQAKVIIVVSPHLKRRIEAYGIPGEKILVLPNAIDAGNFEKPADGGEIRERHNLGTDTVIGFVGWFTEWHRVDLLVEVFARLYARHRHLKLMLVGEGVLQEALAQSAAKLGIAHHLIFTGSVKHADIPRTIAAMDICVVPHSNEYRSPIKLFEYMGQSRAVVAPRTEPIGMVVSDGLDGLLFEPLSADDLYRRLEELICNPGLRVSLGENARRTVLENHTWERNARSALDRL